MNIPNTVTASRILLAPVLLVLAWQRWERAFLVCLIVSLVTDILDGKLARWLNQKSELGTKLDSWADFLTYMAVPVCAYWLRPDILTNEWPAFVAVVASYTLPVTIGFLKYRRLTSYHTRGAVLSAYLIGASVIVLFAHGPSLPFRIAAVVLVLAELEEIAMTCVLPVWRSNVPSLKHALVLRREQSGEQNGLSK